VDDYLMVLVVQLGAIINHSKTTDEQHKTSPAVIVHNNKLKEDD
jgi:hypothetical protein